MTSEFPASALTPVTRTALRPAYVQIASQIRRVVDEQAVEPGTQVPTESELVERFGVSRMTVREGLRLLRTEGVLRAEHGVGVFVAGESGMRMPVQLAGSLPSSEPAWREAVVRAIGSPDRIGRVGELEEGWASTALGVPPSEIVKIHVTVSDQPGRYDNVRLYVVSTPEEAANVAIAAVENAVAWRVSVRGSGPGDLERSAGDLIVTRTAFDSARDAVLVAQSSRSYNWTVTVTEKV